MLRLLIPVWVLLLIVFSTPALAKETIQWLTWEQVPNFILKGKYKGQGLGDSFTQSLQDKLPQYNHVNIASNAHRYHKLIRKRMSVWLGLGLFPAAGNLEYIAELSLWPIDRGFIF